MINTQMQKMTQGSSAIRAMFEEGHRLASIYGSENVYDFSLGNPSVPAPDAVGRAIRDILDTEDPVMIHGYMSNAGYEDVRRAVAESLNRRFGTALDASHILMTVGAAGGLNIILKTLLNPGDEVICIAPFFGEYLNYIANFGGVPVVVPPDTETFLPNLQALAERIGPKTRAVLLNNPNNPTGVVYDSETISRLAAVLEQKQAEYHTDIYLIADEPYRELVYDDVEVPFVPRYYRNTIVGYSWSKSLSLPGERIGYLLIPPQAEDSRLIFDAACVAGRILGFVNAPSLMQRAVSRCLNEKTDVAAYDRSRRLIYSSLTKLGFSCVRPQGAFYLFVRSPEPDDAAFVQRAAQHRILLVPGSSFACPGYVRLAYCAGEQTIRNSLPAFAMLADEYALRPGDTAPALSGGTHV